jgi:hypothetical protein
VAGEAIDDVSAASSDPVGVGLEVDRWNAKQLLIERDRGVLVLLIDRRRRAVDRRAVRDRFGDLLELLLAGGREAERDVRSGTVRLAARATYASSANASAARSADAPRSPVSRSRKATRRGRWRR